MYRIQKIFFRAVVVSFSFVLMTAGFNEAYSQNKGVANIKSPQKTEIEKNNEDTLRAHVKFLTSPQLQGRGAGSQGEVKASEYIYDYLLSNGLLMLSPKEGEDFKMVQPKGDTLQSRNIIGIIPGYDNALAKEYVLIGAHMDGLGCTTLNVNGKQEMQIYPGADKNASGAAVLLQIAKMISQNKFMFKRSVIIAFFGAGELGMAGSWYFLNRSFSEVDKITLMMDLDAVGLSGENNKLQVFTGVQNPDINEMIGAVASAPFSVTPSLVDKEPFGSDYRNFYQKDIPSVLFTTGTSSLLNTTKDTGETLDYFQMNRIAEFVYSFALAAASRDKKVSQGLKAGEEKVDGKNEIVYTQQGVDHRATFLRGDERYFLKEWVYQYIKYPDSAIAGGIEGTEQVEFIVDKTGAVRDIKITKSLSDDIDNEVIKVFKASPKWKPATINGSNVSVRMSLPVEFILTKKRGSFGIKK
ncbi:MAG: TonB family protein [Bacteroidales bacterium]|jgi:TonB family protein|nr:TonB family protein [Bacteroidales bacterium]MCI1733163.1 TonB family protein [Bacteroidales bacterium]